MNSLHNATLALAKRLAVLQRLLTNVVDECPTCPACGADQNSPHRLACAVQAAIAAITRRQQLNRDYLLGTAEECEECEECDANVVEWCVDGERDCAECGADDCDVRFIAHYTEYGPYGTRREHAFLCVDCYLAVLYEKLPPTPLCGELHSQRPRRPADTGSRNAA